MEAALAASGESIRKRDTVLINMGVNERLFGTPGYAAPTFPDCMSTAVHWLADKGIGIFGVEAVSPAPQGEPNFKAHLACAERGITHIECLGNLEAVVGKGRFTLHRLPAEDPRRHGEPDPGGGDVRRVTALVVILLPPSLL